MDKLERIHELTRDLRAAVKEYSETLPKEVNSTTLIVQRLYDYAIHANISATLLNTARKT